MVHSVNFRLDTPPSSPDSWHGIRHKGSYLKCMRPQPHTRGTVIVIGWRRIPYLGFLHLPQDSVKVAGVGWN